MNTEPAPGDGVARAGREFVRGMAAELASNSKHDGKVCPCCGLPKVALTEPIGLPRRVNERACYILDRRMDTPTRETLKQIATHLGISSPRVTEILHGAVWQLYQASMLVKRGGPPTPELTEVLARYAPLVSEYAQRVEDIRRIRIPQDDNGNGQDREEELDETEELVGSRR